MSEIIFKIEPINESQHVEIADVWEASVRATHDFLHEEDILFFRELILEKYVHSAKIECIKNKANKIVGFISVAKQNIDMLFIHPDYRGKGVGKFFMEYAIETKQANKVDVNEQNNQAVGFYQYFGFKTVTRSELDPTGKPYPVLHMELKK